MENIQLLQKKIEILIEQKQTNAAYKEITESEKKGNYYQLPPNVLKKYIVCLKELGVDWEEYTKSRIEKIKEYAQYEDNALKVIEILNRNYELGFFNRDICKRMLNLCQEKKYLAKNITDILFLKDFVDIAAYNLNSKFGNLNFLEIVKEMDCLNKNDSLFELKLEILKSKKDCIEKVLKSKLDAKSFLSREPSLDEILNLTSFYQKSLSLNNKANEYKKEIKDYIFYFFKKIICHNKFEIAKEIFINNKEIFIDLINEKDIDELIRIIKKDELEKLLNESFFRAESYLLENKEWFSEKEFKTYNYKIVGERQKKIKESSILKIDNLLFDLNFKEAIKCLNDEAELFGTDFEELNKKIQEFQNIKKHGTKNNYEFSGEQIDAIYNRYNSVLLKARAGSGKTLVITSTIDYLINYDNISSNEILALAFNRDAAKEINKRMEKKFLHNNFISGKTFHKLAKDISKYKGEIITNRKKELISKIFIELSESDSSIKQHLLDYFKDDFDENEKNIDMQGKQKEINSKKLNSYNTYETLSGSIVKSHHEKWISDYFFEHGIKFEYEKIIDELDEKFYRPDFYIYNSSKPVILEFFAIEKSEQNPTTPSNWDKDGYKYLKETKQKKKYFRKNSNKYDFIPLYYVKGETKKEFLERLRYELLDLNIQHEKLSPDKIYEKILRKHEEKFRKRIINFIDKAQSRNCSINDLKNKIEKFSGKKKVIAFYEITIKVYKEYEAKKNQNKEKDFYDIFKDAIREIESNNGDILWEKELNYNLKNLKYIFIDEFQDFTPIFYEFISTILKYNKNIRLFCVGDDFQSINGFAGSQIKYFEKFEHFFSKLILSEIRVLKLQNNYRSTHAVIEASNSFRQNEGVPIKGIVANEGEFKICKINGKDARKHSNFSSPYYKKTNEKNLYFSIDFNRYAGICSEIIKYNMRDERIKTIGIVFREKNSLLNKGFESQLKLLLGKNSMDINCDTIHQFKGLEKDLIIIVDVCEKKFPFIHPDNIFDQIFDISEEEILNEERNIFYVALTRAKKKLYIITEKSKESEFLSEF